MDPHMAADAQGDQQIRPVAPGRDDGPPAPNACHSHGSESGRAPARARAVHRKNAANDGAGHNTSGSNRGFSERSAYHTNIGRTTALPAPASPSNPSEAPVQRSAGAE